jgi:PHD/YefM family antitoxin component YafN of YafNO toxin-antitoxin module
VTRREKEAVVILAAEEYERMARRATQAASLSRFFAESPLAGAHLDLRRAADYGREVEL